MFSLCNEDDVMLLHKIRHEMIKLTFIQNMKEVPGGRQGQARGRLALDGGGKLCALQRSLPRRHREPASGILIWGGRKPLEGGKQVLVHDKLVLARGMLVLVQHNGRQDEQGDAHGASCEPCGDTSSCSSWASRSQTPPQD